MKMALMAIALLLPPLCLAQPIYRCQEGAGISYQDRPCAGRGEVLVLPLHRPSASEVARNERRQQQVRRFLHLAELRRSEAARTVSVPPALPDAAARPVGQPSRARVKVILLLPPDHQGQRFAHKKHVLSDKRDARRFAHKHGPNDKRVVNKHRAGRPGRATRQTVICPLGLVNCKKVLRPSPFWPRGAWRDHRHHRRLTRDGHQTHHPRARDLRPAGFTRQGPAD